MLKRFEVENYRGFSKRLVFDLTALDYNFNQSLVSNGIVNKAILYGKNGVGKSALGLAIFDIVSHLTDKNRFSKFNYCNLEHLDKPVSFKYVFSFGNDEVVYEYQKKDEDYLLNEKFFVNGKICVNYDYFDTKESSRFVLPELKGSLNIDLIDNKLSVIKYIYRNTPTDFSSPLTKMVQFCEGMLWYRSLSEGNSYIGYTVGAANLIETIYEKGKVGDFEKFLKQNGLYYSLGFESENNQHVLYAYFDSKDGRNKAQFVQLASTGTMALTLFYVWSLIAFDKVTFLFIDEFDAFFHYESAEMIIKALNKRDNFQSLVTTHNTYLMQNRLTRPDCCFLMTKNKITNLYDATDREIHEAHNLEKMYINGAFKV